MPRGSSTVGPGTDAVPLLTVLSGATVPSRPGSWPPGTAAPCRVVVPAAVRDEDEAALELSSLLIDSGICRPFLVASRYGRQLLAGIRGTVGAADGSSCPSQASARAVARAARRAGADAVVAAGGGHCLDVGKLAAAGAGVPFVAVPTQLSHDGICSPVSVLPKAARRVAESVEAVGPRMAFFSIPTLMRSSLGSVQAGIGDLISNPLAVLDWELAAAAGLDHMDAEARDLSMEAYGLIEPLLDRPFATDDVTPDVIGVLVKALVTSGHAMTAMGTSRPASGAEHKISHAIDELFGGRALHGQQVALASLLSTALHGLDVGDLRRRLMNLGLPHHPHQLLLSRADMIRVLLRAPATRPGRFTVLEEVTLDETEAARLLHWVWPDL